MVVDVEVSWPPRMRLEDAAHRIFRASVRDMYLPKNAAKTNDFSSYGWLELEDLILDELRESREKAMDGDVEGALEEMGDCSCFAPAKS